MLEPPKVRLAIMPTMNAGWIVWDIDCAQMPPSRSTWTFDDLDDALAFIRSYYIEGAR